MKYKKGLIFICLIICLFSIAGVCASEVNETVVASEDQSELITVEDTDEIVKYDNQNDVNISVDDNVDEIGATEEIELSASQGTFTDLANDIANAGYELNLTRDYVYNSNDSTYENGIIINKTITVNGNGFTINGNNQARAFMILSEGIILNNLTFIDCRQFSNSSAVYASAIYWTGSNGILNNCTFINCHSIDDDFKAYGGAIYWNGANGTVSDCDFSRCYSQSYTYNRYSNIYSYGGAIYWNGANGTVSDCDFSRCYSSSRDYYFSATFSYGGAIYWNGFEGVLVNCSFANCFSSSISSTSSQPSSSRGGAVMWSGGDGTLFNCTFINCSSSDLDSSSFGGAVFLQGDNIQVNNSQFYNNHANGDGGAVYCMGKFCEVINSSFKNNVGGYGGGAICGANTIINCIFVSNSAQNVGGAVYSAINIYNSTFENNYLIKKFTNSSSGLGGAVYMADNVFNSIFRQNNAPFAGGALDMAKYIYNCSFYYNSAKTAGAVYVKSDCELIDCVFINNSAQGGGGAISCVDGEIKLRNSNFINNSAQNSGAILLGSGKNANLNNCTFINNKAANYSSGGAISLQITTQIKDSKFINNIAREGGAIYSISSLTLNNCLFENNNGISAKDIYSSRNYIKIYDSIFINEDLNNYSQVYINSNSILKNIIFYKNPQRNDELVITGNNGEIDQNNVTILDINNNATTNDSAINTDNNTTNNTNSNNTDNNYTNPEQQLKDSVINIYYYGGSIYAGETKTISFGTTYSATGTISLYLNDKLIGTILVGENFNITGLAAGNYTFKARYNGDNKYNSSENSIELNVIKTYPKITINVNETKFGNSAKVQLIIESTYSKINGYVEVSNYYFGKTQVKIVNGIGYLDIPNLPMGEQGVYAEYFGDENHKYTNAFVTFNVIKGDAGSNIIIPTTTDSSGKMVVNLPNGATGTITLRINNENYYFNVNNGVVNIIIPALDKGNYSYTITYSGDNNFSPFLKSGTLAVDKTRSKIVTSSITTVYNTGDNLIINLKDINNRPIGGVTLSVDLNGIKYLTTDSNGQIKVSTNGLVPTSYVAKVSFGGNNKYIGSAFTVKVTVIKATPKLTAKAKTFKKSVKTKKYTVTLKDNNGKAMAKVKLTLKVKGKTYKATTNAKGKAVFKIKKLTKKGKYKATIKFAGNNCYNKVTKKVKITIK